MSAAVERGAGEAIGGGAGDSGRVAHGAGDSGGGDAWSRECRRRRRCAVQWRPMAVQVKSRGGGCRLGFFIFIF
jgi:hypothetical protein